MSTSEDARIAALTAKICALSLRVQQLENKQLENVEAISSQNLASAGALRGNAPTFVPTSTPSEGGPGGKEKLASKDQLVPKEKSVPEEKPAGQEIRPRRERHARRERYAHNAKPATPKTQTGGRMYAFGGTETRREGQPRGERPRPKERRAPNELPATQGPSHRPETNSVFPGAHLPSLKPNRAERKHVIFIQTLHKAGHSKDDIADRAMAAFPELHKGQGDGSEKSRRDAVGLTVDFNVSKWADLFV